MDGHTRRLSGTVELTFGNEGQFTPDQSGFQSELPMLPTYVACRLPCGIDMRGPVEHGRFYLGDLGQCIYFRGRELFQGKAMLPEDTQAFLVDAIPNVDGNVVCDRPPPPVDVEAEVTDNTPSSVGRLTGRVENEIMYYVHGSNVDDMNNTLSRATQWLKLASALHAPCKDASIDDS